MVDNKKVTFLNAEELNNKIEDILNEYYCMRSELARCNSIQLELRSVCHRITLENHALKKDIYEIKKSINPYWSPLDDERKHNE